MDFIWCRNKGNKVLHLYDKEEIDNKICGTHISKFGSIIVKEDLEPAISSEIGIDEKLCKLCLEKDSGV